MSSNQLLEIIDNPELGPEALPAGPRHASRLPSLVSGYLGSVAGVADAVTDKVIGATSYITEKFSGAQIPHELSSVPERVEGAITRAGTVAALSDNSARERTERYLINIGAGATGVRANADASQGESPVDTAPVIVRAAFLRSEAMRMRTWAKGIVDDLNEHVEPAAQKLVKQRVPAGTRISNPMDDWSYFELEFACLDEILAGLGQNCSAIETAITGHEELLANLKRELDITLSTIDSQTAQARRLRDTVQDSDYTGKLEGDDFVDGVDLPPLSPIQRENHLTRIHSLEMSLRNLESDRGDLSNEHSRGERAINVLRHSLHKIGESVDGPEKDTLIDLWDRLVDWLRSNHEDYIGSFEGFGDAIATFEAALGLRPSGTQTHMSTLRLFEIEDGRPDQASSIQISG